MEQVGWGGEGGPNLPPPIHCIPGRTPLFLLTSFLIFALFRLQNSRGLPYPSPISTTSHPTAPPKTKVFAFYKLLYATRPRTGRIKSALDALPVRSCQMFAFRRGETLTHRKRGRFHLLFAECFWQWGIGALHGKFQR